MTAPRILIAGIGNILRGDDGFGPAVVQALQKDVPMPENVRCLELGLGGIGLVHELLNGYDMLVIVDAVDRGGAPGTLYQLEPVVPNGSDIPESERHSLATDLHEAVPRQTLILSRALGVLPPVVRLLGCQPAETEELTLELSPAVRQAVAGAIEILQNWFQLVPRHSEFEAFGRRLS